MSPLFKQIRPDELPDPHRVPALAMEEHFETLDRFFHLNLQSSARLKRAPDENISTPAAVRELAGLYALRSMELAEGGVLSIEARNSAAAMPIARSLLEVWMAIRFVDVRFSKFVEDGNPEGFEDTVRRLLTGRSSGLEPRRTPVSIGTIRGVALEAAREEELELDHGKSTAGRELGAMYDQLSDASHPSQWSMMAYYEERADGLGNNWLRKPQEMPDLYALSLIGIPLGYIRLDLVKLMVLADKAETLASEPDTST